ncbi:MAG: acetyltransferase [Micrococcales bacterium]
MPNSSGDIGSVETGLRETGLLDIGLRESTPKLLMVGAGGHARVLQELLAEAGIALSGYVAPAGDSLLHGDLARFDESALTDGTLASDQYLLVNGIGSAGATTVRAQVFAKLKSAGFSFLQLEAQSAHVSASAVLSEGVQVMHRAVVHTDAFVDDNTIINTGAIVEHHNRIGANCHIAIGATLSGQVTVGAGTHIGANATVIQGVKIGENCIIGAGAVVLSDVPDNHTAVGVPAVSKPNKPAKGGNA